MSTVMGAGARTTRPSADYLFEAEEPASGVHLERWRHAYGCGKWFNRARDTLTLEVYGAYPARASEPPECGRTPRSAPAIPHGSSAREPPPRHRRPPRRPRKAGELPLQRQALPRLRGRHAGVGAARERRDAGRALVQVPPPARDRGGGVEEPNALVGLGTGGRFEPNARATDQLVEGSRPPARTTGPASASTSASSRPGGAAPAGRLLLQDLHRAACRLEARLRAGLSAARPASARRRPPPTPTRYEFAYAYTDVLIAGGRGRPASQRRSPPARPARGFSSSSRPAYWGGRAAPLTAARSTASLAAAWVAAALAAPRRDAERPACGARTMASGCLRPWLRLSPSERPPPGLAAFTLRLRSGASAPAASSLPPARSNVRSPAPATTSPA